MEMAGLSQVRIKQLDKVMSTQKSRCKEMERGGHSCLAFARARLGYLYVESEKRGDHVRYAEKGASGGKRERKMRS